MEPTFKSLVLHEGYYSDSGAEITDENGFAVINAHQTAILLGYAGKLGIDHWADDERARLELTKEQQAANARHVVACVNALEGMPTLQIEMLDVKGALDSADEARSLVTQLLHSLRLAQEALAHSEPIMGHYPEPVQRHERARNAVTQAIADATSRPM